MPDDAKRCHVLRHYWDTNERVEEVNKRSVEVNEQVVEEIEVIERGHRTKSINEFEEERC